MPRSTVPLAIFLLLSGVGPEAKASDPNVRLFEWEKGVGVRSRLDEDMTVFPWFYEWNMFDARQKGIHTPGSHAFEREVSEDGNRAVVRAPDMTLTIKAIMDGADFSLTIKNRTSHLDQHLQLRTNNQAVGSSTL